MTDQVTDSESAALGGHLDPALSNEIPTPRLLYKYFKYYPPTRCEWTKRIFKDNEVYFATPKDFNGYTRDGP